jgi:hypothetical protein
VLRSPVKWQIEFGQARHRQFDWLPTLHDRLDQSWAQEGEIDKAPDIVPVYAITSSEFLQ